MKSFFGTKVKSVYNVKRKVLTISGLDKSVSQFIGVIGGQNVKVSGSKVTIDVSKVSDVDQALSMISIVTEVK